MYSKKKPYLSVVVIGRNDDYGHRFLHRVNNFIDNLINLCERYHLYCELLFVEWNPPQTKSNIWCDLILRKSNYLALRFLTVSKKIHESFNPPKIANLGDF